MLDSFTRAFSRTLEIAIVACLAIMCVLVFGNVVLRYGFDSGIVWSEEMSRLVFVWMIFLGAILAAKDKAHIVFDSLLNAMPAPLRKLCVAFTAAVILACCAAFIVGGWQQTVINMDNEYPVLGISYAWLYGVAIVFGAGMALTVVLNLWSSLRAGSEGGRP